MVLALLCGLCACGAAGSTAPTAGTDDAGSSATAGSFRVGYGQANITPDDPVPMAGYGRSDQRISNGVINYLMATCLAITDEDDNTILLISTDLVAPHDSTPHAPTLSELTGVPVENIVIAATHTHSSPDFSYSHMPEVARAKEKMLKGLEKAALAAMEDRKPAQMFGGSVKTESLNFVRHYLMNDGTYCGDNFGSAASGYKDHASQADPLMQLIKFTREGGQDVVLANFQMHPHRTGGYRKPDVSADVTGAMRKAYEEKTGCLFAYFSGDSGNVNGHSRIQLENATQDHIAHGKALADYALQIKLRDVQLGQLKAASKVLDAPINHDEDHLLPQAQEIDKLWKETKDQAICKPLLEKYGFNSVYRAGALVARVNMPETLGIPLWTLSMGDIAFVGAPYEMFDTNGQQIKDASPFRMTFIMTLTNDGYGYMPSRMGFEHGGYSTDTCRFKPGIGELLAENYIELLESMA
jgi:hypothetical protein